MNAFDQMREALNEAKQVQRAAEQNAAEMGQLLIGNLRHCSDYTLRELKKELSRYNRHTGTWSK